MQRLSAEVKLRGVWTISRASALAVIMVYQHSDYKDAGGNPKWELPGFI